jgi:hypothetical protein
MVTRIIPDPNEVEPLYFHDPYLECGKTVTFFSLHEFVSSLLRRALITNNTPLPFLQRKPQDSNSAMQPK